MPFRLPQTAVTQDRPFVVILQLPQPGGQLAESSQQSIAGTRASVKCVRSPLGISMCCRGVSASRALLGVKGALVPLPQSKPRLAEWVSVAGASPRGPRKAD